MAHSSDRQLMLYLLLGALVVVAIATYAMVGLKTHERARPLDQADLAPLEALLITPTSTPVPSTSIPSTMTPTSTTSTTR